MAHPLPRWLSTQRLHPMKVQKASQHSLLKVTFQAFQLTRSWTNLECEVRQYYSFRLQTISITSGRQ